eukprot:13385_1
MLAALSLLDATISRFTLGLHSMKHANSMDPTLIINNKFINYDYDYQKISRFVNKKLCEISAENNCSVLLCAERSSHVWGTSHSKSDNDVKAIIYYQGKDYYSPTKQINKSWKVIYGPRNAQQTNTEQEPDVELNCIELTKIGQMIIKNDPNVFEIFTSPLMYYNETQDIVDRFKDIIYSAYKWHKLATHYLAWARGNHKYIADTKKKRVAKKPLKILFVVWRGILSAEWLINHKTCKGLPLYVPDLITYSRLLLNEEKKVVMMLLTTKVRKSCFQIDCNESRNLMVHAKKAIEVVDQMLSENNPNQSQTDNDHQGKNSKDSNPMSIANKLDQLVVDVIESFV